MKTEPTQAKGWIRHRKGKYYFGEVVSISEAEAGCDIAFEEGQENPKIKQLEWDVIHPNHYVKDTNPIGYIAKISERHIGATKYVLSFAYSGERNAKIYNTLEEAKVAAQEDFETRIKECLKIDPVN